MAFALAPEVPAPVEAPAILAPAARDASFGLVTGSAERGTHRVVVYVDGDEAGSRRVQGSRFSIRVSLPPRDAEVRVVAEDALGNRAARTVAPVFGLPGADGAGAPRPYEDRELARKLDALVDDFPGISGVYVEHLATGAGAAWNARARFPAASTVKLAIAIEVLRTLDARPPPGSDLDAYLRLMLIESDNEAANELLRWLGGSAEGGAAEVNEMLAAVGLGDTELYGGFLVGGGRPPIPLTVESQPSFEGKFTTAWDLARLHRGLHLAAAGRGPLLGKLAGFTAPDARFLLWILVRSADHGKLDRYAPAGVVVPHKAGWISEARHDSGLVYGPGGVFVASVMTYTGGGAGDSSDELAGRVAELALEHFGPAEQASSDDSESSGSGV